MLLIFLRLCEKMLSGSPGWVAKGGSPGDPPPLPPGTHLKHATPQTHKELPTRTPRTQRAQELNTPLGPPSLRAYRLNCWLTGAGGRVGEGAGPSSGLLPLGGASFVRPGSPRSKNKLYLLMKQTQTHQSKNNLFLLRTLNPAFVYRRK